MIIYITINLINDKIYIGQDKYHKKNYFGSGKLLKQAIKEYGKNNFAKFILEVITDNDNSYYASERENYWIEYFDSRNLEKGYNIAKAGKNFWTGCNHTNEAKEKIGFFWKNKKRGASPLKGKHRSEETKQKISKANKGKTHTYETKEKNRLSHLGKKASDETRKKMRESYLKSENVKKSWELGERSKKISENRKGKGIGIEPKNKGIPCSLEQKRKISETLKFKNKIKKILIGITEFSNVKENGYS